MDPFMAFLGIRVVRVLGDEATVEATVQAQHINLHGTAHGGFVFSVADAAFALASNSGPGRQVGLHADLHYHRPARLGDTVRASAREVHLGRKTGSYHLEVRVGDRLVATGTGLVYRVEDGPDPPG